MQVKKSPDKAEAALKASQLTGYKVKELDPSLVKVAQKLEKADLTQAAKKDAKKPVPAVPPREVSLFPVDKFGEVDSAATKPAAPEGFMIVHF